MYDSFIFRILFQIIENIVCCLRNLSYKIDVEIDRNVHVDAIRAPAKADSSEALANQQARKSSRDGPSVRDNGQLSPATNKKNKDVPRDASKTGCLGMKKKPFKARIENRNTLQPNKKPPPEQWRYFAPGPENSNIKTVPPTGVELLWQADMVTIYIHLLTNSTNPVTLEAAAAAIHNLCGGKWNVSILYS